MSGGGNKEKPQEIKQPESKPSNERTYIDGKEVSNRLYDKKSNTYSSNVFLDPMEADALQTGRSSFADLLKQVQPAISVSPEQHAAFAEELYAPQGKSLKENYNQLRGQATNNAAARGMGDSVGFHNYVTNQLDKNYASADADLRNNANLQAYSLPGMKLDPIMQALSIFDTSIQAPTNRGLANLDPSFRGSSASQQLDLQRQQLDMQRQQYNNGLRAQNGGGFFSSFFG